MNKKWIKYALIALVPLVAYFVNVEWQTRLGQQALDATKLDFRSLDKALVKAEG